MSNDLVVHDNRPREELHRQFEFERSCAAQLMTVGKAQRRELYARVYDELYREFPNHPLRRIKDDPDLYRLKALVQLRLLKRFLGPEKVFLEVGAGDCAAAIEVSKVVAKVYAVEVSEEIAKSLPASGNLELLLSDGSSIPLPDESVDVAYSRHLMEHMHPDDAWEQLEAIYRILKTGGRFILLTPNRVNGPWDISRPFQHRPEGLHLKEYTNGELISLLRRAGFRDIRSCRKRLGFLLPVFPIVALEHLLLCIPNPLRQKIATWRPVEYAINVCLIATK